MFWEGFLLQASLILALGAQNIFVLESGLKKQRHLVAALVCSFCDAILIAVGVLGAASIFVQVPLLKIIFGAAGVLFLLYYGIKKIREGMSDGVTQNFPTQTTRDLEKVILLSLSFSLLNPHVYLDTVVLIGGYSAKFSEWDERSVFGTGAASFSFLWFFGLAVFASYMGRFLQNPKALRRVSLVSGLILLVLSWKLGWDVYQWIA